MKEVQALLIGTLLISLVILGATQLMSDFSGSDVELPGADQGQELTESVNSYIGNFEDVTEEESGSVGFLGLAGLMKTVLLDGPAYAINVVLEIASWVGLPISAISLVRASIYVIIIIVGILILRGVKT